MGDLIALVLVMLLVGMVIGLMLVSNFIALIVLLIWGLMELSARIYRIRHDRA